MISSSCCPNNFPDAISALFYISHSLPDGTVEICHQVNLGLKWQKGGGYALAGGPVGGIDVSADLACLGFGNYNFIGHASYDFGHGCAGGKSANNTVGCGSIGGGVPLNSPASACCPSVGGPPNGTVYFSGEMVPMETTGHRLACDYETMSCAYSFSSGPVNYSSGELAYQQSDVSGRGGFGVPWGHTRSFVSRLSENESVGQGYNWQVAQWPYLVLYNPASIAVMGQAQGTVWFNWNGTQYVPEFDVKMSLDLDTANQVYRLTKSNGSYTEFDEHTGTLVQTVDAAGNTLVVHGIASNNFNLTDVRRTYTSGSDTIVEQWLYTYSSSMGDLLLSSVTLRRQTNGGAWEDVSQALYTYYGFGSPNGGPEDLETATTQVWDGSAWQTTGTCYYRYYRELGGSSSSSSSSSTSSSSSSGSSDFYGETTVHLLKYIVQPAAYDRMVADGFNPLTASDATVATYSDFFFDFDDQRRVTRETIMSGSQTFLFALRIRPSEAEAFLPLKK